MQEIYVSDYSDIWKSYCAYKSIPYQSCFVEGCQHITWKITVLNNNFIPVCDDHWDVALMMQKLENARY